MVSATVVDGTAPIRMIRYSADPGDGWWILASNDLPLPTVDDVVTICVHCAIKGFGPEVAAAMDLALADAREGEDGVGVVVRAGDGRWHKGLKGLELLRDDELLQSEDD